MAIAISLQNYLNGRGVPYDVLPHMRTIRSTTAARAVGVAKNDLAKGVLMRHPNGYILAILPASRQVSLREVAAMFERPVELASEAEVATIFRDCELGAIPPISSAYGVEAVIDESLEAADDIYFEGGDHRHLVHLRGRDFTELMAEVPHANISVPPHH